MRSYDIIPVRGHFEVFDSEGNFVCSADSYSEAISEIKTA